MFAFRSLKHPDGSISGPYGQCWADVASEDWHVVPGAEFDVELDAMRDIHVRVSAVDRQRPHVPGATVVPEIVAEEIVA